MKLTRVVAFLIEDELMGLGAIFERLRDWRPLSIVDGRRLRENAASSTCAAQTLLKVLAVGKRCTRWTVHLPAERSEEVFMAHKQTAINTEEMKERVRRHQPEQSVLKTILSEDIEWKPYPGYPPSVSSAVVTGQSSDKGPYTIRVKVPRGMKLMPHKHPEDRVYTVISGIFYIGLGGEFDAEKLEAYPPGAVIVLPGNTPHFHWAKSGENISQITAIGPAGLEFVDPKDDLRKGSSPIGAQSRSSRTVSS
jgi:quercetin dioxygenase-like cupin family protein